MQRKLRRLVRARLRLEALKRAGQLGLDFTQPAPARLAVVPALVGFRPDLAEELFN